MRSLQVLSGGTPDPAHYGHLEPVETPANLTGLARVATIPNNAPSHCPQPETNSVQCKHMLEPVTTDKSLSTLDKYELKRDIPPYTTQTLRKWRQEQGPNVSPTFIIGQDSSLASPVRYEYETIFDNTHLIVCRRPGYPLEMVQPQCQQWLEDHLAYNPEDPHSQPAGKIYLAETSWSNVSVITIRKRLQNGESCEDLLPEPVLTYTSQQGLYR